MAAVSAAFAGAALALFAVALGNGLAALYWPQAALGVLVLDVVSGGLAALAVALAPAAWGERVRRGGAALLGLAGVLALASFPVLRTIAAGLPPGAGPLGLTPHFLVLTVAPFVIVAAVLAAWLQAGERRRFAWLMAGAGAGWLAAAALAGTQVPLRAPWFGGHLLEFTPGADGSSRLAIDRGLREQVIAATPPVPLAFLPAPDAGGFAEALLVGLPDGQVLAAFLEQPQLRLTVLEQDPGLVAGVLRRWPALEAARSAGRVSFRIGNPRWSLERTADRYGLIALAPGWSAGARRSSALNLRADHRWTVEAFRTYLERLDAGGYLFVQRDAIGRVVTTLRRATALPPDAFRERLVVFGDPGRSVSQCWYRPAGLADLASYRTTVRYGVDNGTQVLYRPSNQPANSIYDRLVKDGQLQGLYFSTPIDLSPALDERPFFDHLGRLAISPRGRSLPEETEELEEPAMPGDAAPMQIIPRGDREIWLVLLAGIGIAAALLGAGARFGRRGAGPGAPPVALFLGVGAGLALEAFHAWAQWLAPSAAVAQAAFGAVLFGAGWGWLGAQRRAGRNAGLPVFAAVLLLFVLGGYRAAPFLPRLGFSVSALALAAAGVLLGIALGRALGGASGRLEALLPGAGGRFAGTALVCAALAWPAGRLAATHFGYRLIWALAAVAALAALRHLRRLPAAVPGSPPVRPST